MSSIATADRIRIALGQSMRHGRRALLGVIAGPISALRSMRGGDSRLLLASPDMRTADPTIALDIYHGRFVLAGQSVETGGASPYRVPPPSEDWERALHEFGWLRHLRAAETDVARHNAQALAGDWLKSHRRPVGVAWLPEVAARRVLSLLAQSGIILQDADHDFYTRFIRSLIRHGAYLRTNFASVEPGLPRLRAAVAIASIGLSLSRQDDLARFGLDRLDRELASQILPDGGHISRNPAALVEALIDLLPLRQALIARGRSPSGILMSAIDRMMPMLRFFRHGDGSFAHFNGMATSATDTVATILAYDETLGTPVASATHSGYERMARGGSVVLVDTGTPPPMPVSHNAHAGTLSFEFSARNHRMIINCGAPAPRHSALRYAARQTNAHSTAVLNDTSSARFAEPQAGSPLLPGPTSVPRERRNLEEGAIHLEMAHDGYLRETGLIHERDLTLNGDGEALFGTDRFTGTMFEPASTYAIRFHLDPNVRLIVTEDDQSLDLELADGSVWRFQANCPVTWGESICLSDVYGSRPTSQIVLAGAVADQASVDWQIYRTG